MKKLLALLMLAVLCAGLASCDLSLVGTNTGEELPDLVLRPVSPVFTTVYDRRDIPTFEVETENVYGKLRFTWDITAWDWNDALQQGGWASVSLARDLDCASYTPGNFMFGTDRPIVYKVTCYASDVDEALLRDSHASADFYVYLGEETHAPSDTDPFRLVSVTGSDRVFTENQRPDEEEPRYVTLEVEPVSAKGPVTYEWYATNWDLRPDEYYDDYAVAETTYDLSGETVYYEKPEGNRLTVLVRGSDNVSYYLCVASDGHTRAYLPMMIVTGTPRNLYGEEYFYDWYWLDPAYKPYPYLFPEEVAPFGLVNP